MVSFYVNVDTLLGDRKKHNKPDARFRKLLVARELTESRRKAKKKKGRNK